jgi:hypothetical protein
MKRQKRDENYSPLKNKLIQEMKKMDAQFQIPTKQR